MSTTLQINLFNDYAHKQAPFSDYNTPCKPIAWAGRVCECLCGTKSAFLVPSFLFLRIIFFKIFLFVSAICILFLGAVLPCSCGFRSPEVDIKLPRKYNFTKKPFIRDCFNYKGSCTLFRPFLTIAARISSSSFVWVSTRQSAVSSLSKGISSTLNFHESTGTDGTRTRSLSHPKRAPYRLS